MDLRFTVWQFVRLMVHLEQTSRTDKAARALLDAWSDVWAPLDADLARLGQEDMDAYSDLMMNQDVVVEDATAEQAAMCKSAFEAVMAELDAAIAKGSGDEDLLASLKFERRELRQLARNLSRLPDEN